MEQNEKVLPTSFKILGGLLVAQFVIIELMNMSFAHDNRNTLPFGVVCLLLALQIVYFVPGLVASSVNHAQAGAIWMLNIFAGWTAVGWIVALVWAVTKPSETKVIVETNSAVVPVAIAVPALDAEMHLVTLMSMKDKGLITEEEYVQKKTEILAKIG